MRKVNLFYPFLCTSFLCLVSCIDNSYDLSKNVDLTIQVGGDLSIPGCNTEELTLKKIFDMDESDPDNVIKADEAGWYSLLKAGNGTPSEINVKTVDVKESEASEIISELYFTKQELDAVGRAESKIEEDFSTFTMEDNEVSKDLIKINYALPQHDVPLQARIFFDPLLNNVSILHLENDFAVYIPKFLNCKLDESDASTKLNYEFVELDEGSAESALDRKYSSRYNKLKFLKTQTLTNGNELVIPLLVNRLSFEYIKEGQGLLVADEAEYNRLFIEDELILTGTAYILAEEQDAVEGDFQMNLHTNIIMGTPEDVVKFKVDRVQAVINPKIDVTIDPVQFSNLPDFLNDEAVVMDLENPKINLTILNTSPVDVNLYADLLAVKNGNVVATVGIGKGEQGDELHNTTPIIIKANTTTRICLSRLGEGGSDGADNIKVADLNNLIKKIPDQISIENVKAEVLQQEYVIHLGKTYHVTTDYSVDAPLAFGENLQIVYNESVNDWNKDIADYDLEVKEVRVKMEALNKIPLNMQITVEPVDVDGNLIEHISVEQPNNIIPGNGVLGDDAGMKTTPISIRLKTEKEGAMRRLDGLNLHINATTNEEYKGLQLNQNQTLKLNKIYLEVPGGIKMNLN